MVGIETNIQWLIVCIISVPKITVIGRSLLAEVTAENAVTYFRYTESMLFERVLLESFRHGLHSYVLL